MSSSSPIPVVMDDGLISVALWKNKFFLPSLISAAWLGALAWEILYNLPFDICLVFAQGWSTPSRALTRLSYFVSRYLALAAQVILLGFWTNPYLSGEGCLIGGQLYDYTLMFTYLACNTVLLSRAFTFFPQRTISDMLAKAALLIVYLNTCGWIMALPGMYKLTFHKTGKSCRPIKALLQPYQTGLSISMLINVIVTLLIPWIKMSIKLRSANPLSKLLRKSKEQVFSPSSPGTWNESPSKGAYQPNPTAPDGVVLHLVLQGMSTFIFILVVTTVKVGITIAMPDNSPIRSAMVLSGAAILSTLCSVMFRETYKSACMLRHTMRNDMVGDYFLNNGGDGQKSRQSSGSDGVRRHDSLTTIGNLRLESRSSMRRDPFVSEALAREEEKASMRLSKSFQSMRDRLVELRTSTERSAPTVSRDEQKLVPPPQRELSVKTASRRRPMSPISSQSDCEFPPSATGWENDQRPALDSKDRLYRTPQREGTASNVGFIQWLWDAKAQVRTLRPQEEAQGLAVCFQAFDDGPPNTGEQVACETLASVTVIGYELRRPQSVGKTEQTFAPSLPPPPRRARRKLETSEA